MYVCMYVYIYIYIYMFSAVEARFLRRQLSAHSPITCVYVCIYIYIIHTFVYI